LALFDTTWYVSSIGYAAVTARPQNTSVAAGVVRRQFTAPAVNSERCFVCTIAGTTANVTDATWVLTRGAATVDGAATWRECTGQPAVNGDLASTATWAQVKAATPAVVGQIIKRSNNASYQICTTAGAMSASEPAFSDTAGTTTTDTVAVWTSLGPVGNFPAWGAPQARLANTYASTWGAAGHKFFVADNHAETQAAAITLTSPATAAGGPTYAICVDHTAALPPVEANYNTGATITATSAATVAFTFSTANNGISYVQGIKFTADATSSNAISFGQSGVYHILKNCAFALSSSNPAAAIGLGPAASSVPNQVLWDNCTVQFAATGQNIKPQTVAFEWRNTPSAIQGATIPTVLFGIQGNGLASYVVCRGLDLSAFTGQLQASTTATPVPIVFEDCKFNASTVRYVPSAACGYSAAPLITVRCDSGATNYKSTRDEYSGTQTTETSITRVGGATDGTTATSDKSVTNANATFLAPYRMLPLAIWSEVTGADVTVTVYGTINSPSLPTDGELWMDVQYLGSSGSPVASFKSTSKSHPLATAANVSSDGSTWNGGGSGAGWSPFKLVATLTSPQPAMKGFVYINVRAAKPSATYYIDPLPALS
jgi:hypothetical protein